MISPRQCCGARPSDEIESARCVGHVAKDHGGADGRRRLRVLGASHFEIEAGFLNAPDAHLPPAGDGHSLDERGFGGGAGCELEGEGVEELAKAVQRFAFEDDGLGEHAVAAGVLRGVVFAGGGDGAVGFGSVGAGGCDLRVGHSGFRVGGAGEGAGWV